jgi:hypothetical protein
MAQPDPVGQPGQEGGDILPVKCLGHAGRFSPVIVAVVLPHSSMKELGLRECMTEPRVGTEPPGGQGKILP